MASTEMEGPSSNSAKARVPVVATNADVSERPTSAPTERKSEPKKLANAYGFNRSSIRRRAKYLLRKHQKRLIKDKKKEVCFACPCFFFHDTYFPSFLEYSCICNTFLTELSHRLLFLSPQASCLCCYLSFSIPSPGGLTETDEKSDVNTS